MNRSRILQLKSELHHVLIEERSMMQYLSYIKSKCDAIATSNSPLVIEDMIIYMLKGIPSKLLGFQNNNTNESTTHHIGSFLCIVV